jgi:hypothetical protein
MNARRLRRTSYLLTSLLALAVACDDEAAPDRPDTLDDAGPVDDEDAGHSDEGEEDASSPAPDAGSAPAVNGPSDRCFEGTCGPAVLPDQADFGFLSDAGDGWIRLLEAQWELGPRSEGYRCVRKTMPEDVYIAGFKPLNPLGAHHATLHVETGAAPDGVTVCGVGSGGVRRLQGSGVGTEATELPPGVAMKLAKGEQLMVNLHLFNVREEALRGTSGVWIKRVAKADVMQEAENVLAGPLALSIPPGQVKQSGTCTLRKAVTLFSVGPHMHQLGRYMKVTAHSSLMGERVLFDGPYDFTHQLSYKLSNIEMAAGDKVSIECTYMNDTPRTVGWGDSTLDEMCFAGLAVYPAFGAGGFPCAN